MKANGKEENLEANGFSDLCISRARVRLLSALALSDNKRFFMVCKVKKLF